MEKFTLKEIENYLKSQDSFGDMFYNLSEKNIKKANKTISVSLREVSDSGYWEEFCKKYGVNEWCINEGADEEAEYDILLSDAKKWDLI